MMSSAIDASLWNDYDSDGEYVSNDNTKGENTCSLNAYHRRPQVNDTQDLLSSIIQKRNAEQKEKAKKAEAQCIERQHRIESYKEMFIKKNDNYPFWNPKKIAPSVSSYPDVDVPISVRRIRSLDGTNYEEIYYGEGGSADILSTSVMPKGDPFTMEEYVELFCKKKNGKFVYLTTDEMKDRYWKDYDGKEELNVGDIVLCQFEGMKDCSDGRVYCGGHATECVLRKKTQDGTGAIQYEGKMLYSGFRSVITNIYPNEIALKRIRTERSILSTHANKRESI